MPTNKRRSKSPPAFRVTHKWCFVPHCRNTSKNAPSKIFISVPRGRKRRKQWFKAVNRDDMTKSRNLLFCCEDHFNLEEDLPDSPRIDKVITSGARIFVKDDVVPHKFECRRNITEEEDRQLFTSMIRQRMSKLFAATNLRKNTDDEDDDDDASTSTNLGCRNSSAKTPDKIFITVPIAQKRREAWFAAVNRDVTEVSAISPRYCCEDHFDIEKDMDNYMEYRLSHVRARMRPEVVPHKYLDGNVPKQPRQRKKTKKAEAAKQVSVFVPAEIDVIVESQQQVIKEEDPLELDETTTGDDAVLTSDFMDVQMKIEVEESEFVQVKEEEVFIEDEALL